MGFNDAENYKRREDKAFLNKVFLIDDNLNKLLSSSKYFLIGEKGTGKTAYSVYLSNNDIANTLSSIKYVRETNYRQFISLKNSNSLILSDYTLVWKVIIYLLVSEEIKRCINWSNPLKAFNNYKLLNDAIKEYYDGAFDPEVMSAFEFVVNSEDSIELVNKFFKVGGKEGFSKKQVTNKFQMNLHYLKKQFEDAFGSIKLKKSFILFIDGIDIRPEGISQEDYIACIKGLTHAIWEVNNDFFANIKGLEGNKIKVMLLIRPDIFNKMGLQNQNNKIRDNSVLLEWKTRHIEYKQSNLFKLADKLLSVQQDEELDFGEAWDYYFPYSIPTKKTKTFSPFLKFLRYSFYRPRDIISMLDIMKMYSISKNEDSNYFSDKDFENSREAYSNYLLGEIRDHLIFYYTEEEYISFLKFFEYLKGETNFYYKSYLSAHEQYINYLNKNNKKIPPFADTPEKFLQFLYELNIICYIEQAVNENYYYWCYKERNYANMNPKVKLDSYYWIHEGLFKAINVGKKPIF